MGRKHHWAPLRNGELGPKAAEHPAGVMWRACSIPSSPALLSLMQRPHPTPCPLIPCSPLLSVLLTALSHIADSHAWRPTTMALLASPLASPSPFVLCADQTHIQELFSPGAPPDFPCSAHTPALATKNAACGPQSCRGEGLCAGVRGLGSSCRGLLCPALKRGG